MLSSLNQKIKNESAAYKIQQEGEKLDEKCKLYQQTTLPDSSTAPDRFYHTMEQFTQDYPDLIVKRGFLTLFVLFREQQVFKSHFIFFDEILDSLDVPGSQSLIEWLKYKAEVLGISMFMITHHFEHFEQMPNTIKVTKDYEMGTCYQQD